MDVKQKHVIAVTKYYNKNRQALFDILGRKCVICGFDDERALQFDHINGGGNKDRGGYKRSHRALMCKYVLDPDVKLKLQVLCANCNWIKRYEKKEHS